MRAARTDHRGVHRHRSCHRAAADREGLDGAGGGARPERRRASGRGGRSKRAGDPAGPRGDRRRADRAGGGASRGGGCPSRRVPAGRARRARQQRRHRRRRPAGADPAGGPAQAVRGQRVRAGGGHAGDAAGVAPRRRADRVRVVDRRARGDGVHRSVRRLQARDRGDWRRPARGAAQLAASRSRWSSLGRSRRRSGTRAARRPSV